MPKSETQCKLAASFLTVLTVYIVTSVTRLGDLMDFGQLLKDFGIN